MSEDSRLSTNIGVSGVPMISLDLNLNSLKDYLDSIANSMNQHAELINALQTDIKQRLEATDLPMVLNGISSNIQLYDNRQIEQVDKIVGNGKKQEYAGRELENSQNKFINKMITQGNAVTYNYQRLDQLEKQIKQMSQNLDKKADKDAVSEKHRKLKEKISQEMEDIHRGSEKRDWELESKLQAQINSFEEKMGNLEKKTLWKIQDLEEIVKRRITEEYVDDSLRIFEERIKRELIQAVQFDSDRIEKIQGDLLLKIQQLENNLQEKLKSNKKGLKDLEDKFSKKVVIKDIYDDYRKQNNQSVQDLQKKVREIEKKNDYQPVLERLNQKIQAQQEQLQDLDDQLQRKFAELMMTGGGGGQRGDGDGTGVPSNIDPHKLCQLEGDLRVTMRQTDKQQDEIFRLKEELKQGLEAMGLNIYEQGMVGPSNAGKGKLQDLQDKLLELEGKVSQMQQENDMNQDQEKFRRLTNDMKALQQKFENLRDIEKKVGRLFRDFDINTIIKQLRQKADQDDVLKDFAIMDTKINTNTENIGFLRKDVDSLIALVRKLVTQVQNGPSQDAQSILTTKKLHPVQSLNCLSCGTAKTIPKDQKQGIDGKYYKIDPRYTQFDQMQETASDYFGNNRSLLNINNANTQSSFNIGRKQQNNIHNRPSTAQVRDQNNNTGANKDSKGKFIRPGSAKK